MMVMTVTKVMMQTADGDPQRCAAKDGCSGWMQRMDGDSQMHGGVEHLSSATIPPSVKQPTKKVLVQDTPFA